MNSLDVGSLPVWEGELRWGGVGFFLTRAAIILLMMMITMMMMEWITHIVQQSTRVD